MIKRISSVALITLFLCSCPHNGAGPVGPTKTDPYAIARAVIQGAQLSLFVADGVFEQWALQQTDQEKVKAARAKYTHIRTAVVDGLRLALDAVNIAQQAATDPDLSKILLQADAAWQDLKALLTDLLGKTPVPPPPSSAPAKVVAKEKYKTFTVADLPVSFVPPKVK